MNTIGRSDERYERYKRWSSEFCRYAIPPFCGPPLVAVLIDVAEIRLRERASFVFFGFRISHSFTFGKRARGLVQVY